MKVFSSSKVAVLLCFAAAMVADAMAAEKQEGKHKLTTAASNRHPWTTDTKPMLFNAAAGPHGSGTFPSLRKTNADGNKGTASEEQQQHRKLQLGFLDGIVESISQLIDSVVETIVAALNVIDIFGIIPDDDDDEPPTSSPTPAALFSECLAGTYQDETTGNCVACPANSNSLPGALSVEDCTCDGGYTQQDDSSCQACPSNTIGVNETTCEPCLDGLTSPPGSTEGACTGCGNNIIDSGEECDEGFFNGEEFSDCTSECKIIDTPKGCCKSSPTVCVDDVLESECQGSFGAFGVCDPFSDEPCKFGEEPTESLCTDHLEDCTQDTNECVTATCNAATDVCEYAYDPDYVLEDGVCKPVEEPQCSGDPSPCPGGQTQGATCCESCPSDTFESGGACSPCPEGSTSYGGSSGISECFVPEGDVCPAGTPSVSPSWPPSVSPSSPPSFSPSWPPSASPTPAPSAPTAEPSAPTAEPSAPTAEPSTPTAEPSAPTPLPSAPTPSPSPSPTPVENNSSLIPVVENTTIVRHHYYHSRRLGLCDDECKPLNAKRKIVLDGIQMKNFHSPVSPGTVADLVGAAEALGHLSTLANLANVGAGATQSAKAALLEATKAFIDSGTSGTLAGACIQGALALGRLAMCRNGAAIWIKLKGECCLSTSCCIFWSNNEWVEKEYWHKCSAAPKGGIQGLGFMKNDVAGVRKAIPGCIIEAVKAFKCP